MANVFRGSLVLTILAGADASVPNIPVSAEWSRARTSLRRKQKHDTNVALFVHHSAARRHSHKTKTEGALYNEWDTAPPAKAAKFEDAAAACSADMEWLKPGEYDSLTFRCLAGACVPIQGRCNGVYNCGDGSDEMDCPTRHPDRHLKDMSMDCAGLQLNIQPGSHDEVTFRCLGGSCAPLEARCNGFSNCGDDSDELECHEHAHGKHTHTHSEHGRQHDHDLRSHEASHGEAHHSGHAHAHAHKAGGHAHRMMSRKSGETAILTSDFGDADPDEEAASTMELSQAGYEAVVASGEADAMAVFVRRVIAQEGLEVMDEGALSGMLPYYSGECKVQSYADLVEELHGATLANKCHGQWVQIAPPPAPPPLEDATDGPPEPTPAPEEQLNTSVAGPIDGVNLASGTHRMRSASQERALAWQAAQTDVLGYVQQKVLSDGLPHIGESAPLDNHGYHQVRAEHSSLEMGLFIRRVLKEHGLVADETALQYCVPWYSGECDSKSYHFLLKELHEGLSRPAHCGGPWVERLHKKAGRK